MFSLPAAIPREDPAFHSPSGARFQDVSEWSRLFSDVMSNEAAAAIYNSPKNLDEIRKKVHGTLPYGELYQLEAWGASGDPSAVPFLIQWYPAIQEPMWAYSILAGLARSMNPEAHRFVLETLAGIDVSQLPSKSAGLRIEPAKIVLLLALQNPAAAAKLLADSRTAAWAADSLLKIPAPSQFDDWLDAARQRRVELSEFFTYLDKTWTSLPPASRKKACDFLWNLPVESTTTLQWAPLASNCPSAGVSPQWTALLGRNSHMLQMLSGVRNQPWLRLPSHAFFFLDSLLKEFSSQPSWERILLEVLGQVQSPDAVRRVASYVLHENLWLREQALSSLSMGAHPSAGRMLHAAALENAGEEAIAYFLPYLYYTHSLPAHHDQRRILVQVAQRYLKSQEPSYVQASLLVLAWNPEGPSPEAWPVAEQLVRDQVLRKDWNNFEAFLPVLARFPRAEPWLSMALSHPQTDVVLAAETALALTPRPALLPRLRELVRSPQKKLAVNAAFALAQAADLEGSLAALESAWWEAKSHAVRGLAAVAPNPRACAALLEELSSTHTTAKILADAVPVLLHRCEARFAAAARRKMALLPLFMLELIAGNAHLSLPPELPFFMRLLNNRHLSVPGKKFAAILDGHRPFFGFTGFGGVIFLPKVSVHPVRIEWLQ